MMMKRGQPIIPTSFHLHESPKKRQKKIKPEVSSSCNSHDEQARVLQPVSSQYYHNSSGAKFYRNTVPSLPFNTPLHNVHQTTTYPPKPPTSLYRQQSILNDGDSVSTFGCKFHFVDVDLFRTKNRTSKQPKATATTPPLLLSSSSSAGYSSSIGGGNTGTSPLAPNPLVANSPIYSVSPKNNRRVTTPTRLMRNSFSLSMPPKFRSRVVVPRRPSNSKSIEALSSLKKRSQSPDVFEGPTESKEQRESLLKEKPASQQETKSSPKFPVVLNADKRGAIKSLLQAFKPPLSNNPGATDISASNISDASTDASGLASLQRALESLYHEIQERKSLILQLARACGLDGPEAVMEAPDLVECKSLLLQLMGKSSQESQLRERVPEGTTPAARCGNG